MPLTTASPTVKPVIVNAPKPAAAPAKPSQPKRAFTIAITSGKGGVGKTNLSVNLAATLSALKRSVILLDADMGLANANLLCGVKSKINLSHVVAGTAQITDILTPTTAGFSLIPGASGIASMAALNKHQRAHLLSQLESLQSTTDALLFDTGAGIGREVLCFTKSADLVLLITTPEPTAMLDAYAVLKVLTREMEDAPPAAASTIPTIALIVNQAKSAREAQTVHANIMSVAQKFLKNQVPLLGHVLADPAVPLAVRQRVPFALTHPQSPASQSLLALTQSLNQIITQARPPKEETSFFKRLFSWWS